MKNLESYLKNPFQNPAISENRLAAFTTDHLGRLAQIPHPQLHALIAPTTAAMAAYDDTLTDDSTTAARRRMRKAAKKRFRRSVPGQVRLIMAGVRRALAAAARPPEDVLRYLPQGLRPFSRVPDDALDNELKRFATALADQVAVVGQPLADEAAALLAAWLDIYAHSEQSSSQKTHTAVGRRAARAALATRLHLNLLTIALQYPGQPAQLALYMQQSLLHPAAPPPPPPIQPCQIGDPTLSDLGELHLHDSVILGRSEESGVLPLSTTAPGWIATVSKFRCQWASSRPAWEEKLGLIFDLELGPSRS